MKRSSLAVLVGVLALCVGSCGTEEDRFPPRPADLGLTDVAACDSLTKSDASDLGIVSSKDDVLDTGTNDCTFRTTDSRFWGVRIQPQNPIGQYDPEDPAYIGVQYGFQDPRVTTVDGYGAVEFLYSLTGDEPGCNLAVDAGSGGTVVVDYSNGPGGSTAGRDETCAGAARAASMVITTLRSRAAG